MPFNIYDAAPRGVLAGLTSIASSLSGVAPTADSHRGSLVFKSRDRGGRDMNKPVQRQPSRVLKYPYVGGLYGGDLCIPWRSSKPGGEVASQEALPGTALLTRRAGGLRKAYGNKVI